MQNAKLANAAATFNELATVGTSALTFDQAFKMLKEAKADEMISLSKEYFSFPKPGKYFFVVSGFGEFVKDGKVVPVVELTDESKNNFINGDKMLYSSCKRLSILPAFIAVDYTGDEKGELGTYKKLNVSTVSA